MFGSSIWGPILSWLWDHREGVKENLDELYRWFGTRKKGRILILGPGGTGKTTLARLLSGEFQWLLDPPGVYAESIAVEHYKLAGAPGVEVVVPPGQELRRDLTWDDLLADVREGKFRGIILVGAYGYHSLDLSYKRHELYQGSKAPFLQAYLSDRQGEEVRVLRKLVPHLRGIPAKRKTWILTVIAKQDLWWPEHSKVEEHYRNGEYAREVQRILEGHELRSVRHEIVLASFVISNFCTGREERLQKNTAGYDQRLHVHSLRRLFETIDALRQWEAER